MNQTMVQSFLLLSFILKIASTTASCDCHNVGNWEELRTLIMTTEYAGVQVNLPLCPFNIEKDHDQNTYHWENIIYISKPMHIYCKKENPEDKCEITVLGDRCSKNENCGRQLFKLMSDNIWLQGITINHAKDVVVNVDKGTKNIKLVDMTFVGNEVPPNDNNVSPGVVAAELDTYLEVLHSSFSWNLATPIYSRGSLVVHGSYFHGNQGTKYFQKGGAIFSKGETVISKSSFLYNWGGPGGFSLYSGDENFLDAGGNCFKSQNDWGCQGIQIQNKCFPFIGTDTTCPEVVQ